jgi:hypothetical protein
VITDDWEISRAGGGKYYKNTSNDPVTIVKLFRHIFCEPETEDWMHCEKSRRNGNYLLNMNKLWNMFQKKEMIQALMLMSWKFSGKSVWMRVVA